MKPRSRTSRELAIYDGQDCLGTIKVAEDGTARVFDPRGKRLGLFPSFEAASAALTNTTDQAARQP
jgi:hypothetical protein